MPHVTLIGNCHGLGIAQVMAAIGQGVTATAIVPTPDNRARIQDGGYDDLLASSARVLVQPGGFQRIDGTGSGRYVPHDRDDPVAEAEAYVRARHPAVPIGRFPKVLFSAFHPDFDFVRDRAGVRFDGPCGHHSALIFYAWQRGLSASATAALFHHDVFAHLGYFDYWPTAAAFLADELHAADLALDDLVARWTARGVWMYSFNHPRLFVLADIARAVLRRDGLPFDETAADAGDDALARQTVFPVYPALAARLGVEGGYRFQLARSAAAAEVEPPVLTLPQFIDACMASYAGHRPDELVCHRLGSARYRSLDRVRPKRARVSVQGHTANPFVGLPRRQYWKHAVERTAAEDIDPGERAAQPLSRADRVATAGSCFAQHISHALVGAGFRFLVTEPGTGLDPGDDERRGYGMFSARYGNIYSARQLVQLFDRAFGDFAPAEPAWQRSDGRVVDPFRPRIEPDGFANGDAVAAARVAHLAAVREMFEQLDVFVFTLGLTETWRSRDDGAVFPLAPGVVAGAFDPTRHVFVNADVAEVTADLHAFIARLRRVNPGARLVLTVSPVPLAATYEARHVLVATAYSKAVLRVAVEQVCQAHERCDYFPSFEIITGPAGAGRYFAADGRSVTAAGVAHVMRVFLRRVAGHETGGPPALGDELTRELRAVSRVICDEDAVAASPAAVR